MHPTSRTNPGSTAAASGENHSAHAGPEAQLAILRHLATHDLDNILCVMNSLARQGMEAARGAGSGEHALWRDMLQAIRHAERLSEAAADPGRHLDPGIRVPVAVEALVLDAVARHPAIAASGACVQACGRKARLRTNPFLTQWCLDSYIDNAVKFARPGEPPQIHIGWQVDGRQLRLIVRDRGIGFAGFDGDRLFHAGVRLHRRLGIPGKGRGLALVRSVAADLGGCVGADSVPGEGSTFWLELPLDGAIQRREGWARSELSASRRQLERRSDHATGNRSPAASHA